MSIMEKTWKIGDIFRITKGIISAVFQGKLLMKLKIDKYLPQLIYTFFLCFLAILFSLAVDNTQGKVEKNRAELKELRIENTEKEYELIMLNRRSTVERLLETKGSGLKEPEKPSEKLK